MNIHGFLVLASCTGKKRPHDGDDALSKKLRTNETTPSNIAIGTEDAVADDSATLNLITQWFIKWSNYLQSLTMAQNDDQPMTRIYPQSPSTSESFLSNTANLAVINSQLEGNSITTTAASDSPPKNKRPRSDRKRCSPLLRFKSIHDLNNYFFHFKMLILENVESKDAFLKFLDDCELNEEALKAHTGLDLSYLKAIKFSPALKEFFYEKISRSENEKQKSKQNRKMAAIFNKTSANGAASNKSDGIYNEVLRELGIDENSKSRFCLLNQTPGNEMEKSGDLIIFWLAKDVLNRLKHDLMHRKHYLCELESTAEDKVPTLITDTIKLLENILLNSENNRNNLVSIGKLNRTGDQLKNEHRKIFQIIATNFISIRRCSLRSPENISFLDRCNLLLRLRYLILQGVDLNLSITFGLPRDYIRNWYKHVDLPFLILCTFLDFEKVEKYKFEGSRFQSGC